MEAASDSPSPAAQDISSQNAAPAPEGKDDKPVAQNSSSQNVASAPGEDKNLYERPAGFVRNTVLLTCLSIACMISFTALFSGMGKGIEVTETLLEEKHADMSNSLLGGGALLALLLYLQE